MIFVIVTDGKAGSQQRFSITRSMHAYDTSCHDMCQCDSVGVPIRIRDLEIEREE